MRQSILEKIDGEMRIVPGSAPGITRCAAGYNQETYEHVAAEIKHALPNHYDCIISHDVSDSQLALLHYYANIRTELSQNNSQLNCDFYLIQDDRDRSKYQPGDEWKLIWQGKRPTDRRESFRLFQKQAE